MADVVRRGIRVASLHSETGGRFRIIANPREKALSDRYVALNEKAQRRYHSRDVHRYWRVQRQMLVRMWKHLDRIPADAN
jgi:hypothetical protein